jgi:hypothetical protein
VFAGEGCQGLCAISIDLTEAIPAPYFDGVDQDPENARQKTRGGPWGFAHPGS